MKSKNKIIINIVVYSSIITFILIYLIFRAGKEGYNFETFMGDIAYTSLIICFMLFVFDKWIWRIPFVGRWLHTPNISGEWTGMGKSYYDDTEYECKLIIKQTFHEVYVHGYFEKSQSDSFNSVFIHNDTLDKTYFVYSYQNEPNQEYRNKSVKKEENGICIHYGTTRFVIDYNNLNKMTGSYWNDRNCSGELKLTRKMAKNGK